MLLNSRGSPLGGVLFKDEAWLSVTRLFYSLAASKGDGDSYPNSVSPQGG